VSCQDRAVTIAGKPRCACHGHRLAVGGVLPTQTREQPPSTWLAELRDRRRARLAGRWLGLRDSHTEAAA
jgi:hypothetical protein